MKLLLALSTVLIGSASHAAIAMNYGCTDGQGTQISWELRPNSEGDKMDRLHRDINISFNDVTRSLSEGKLVVGKKASISLWNPDTGESVVVKAKKLIKDNGDEQVYSGKADFLIKTVDGLELRRSVKVTCSVFGEA